MYMCLLIHVMIMIKQNQLLKAVQSSSGLVDNVLEALAQGAHIEFACEVRHGHGHSSSSN